MNLDKDARLSKYNRAQRSVSYRTLIVKPLGLNGRKSLVHTVFILLVESGLGFLGF